eukprot:2151575-Pleurochrysis_carterae.AAC.1
MVNTTRTVLHSKVAVVHSSRLGVDHNDCVIPAAQKNVHQAVGQTSLRLIHSLPVKRLWESEGVLCVKSEGS